MVVHPNKEDEMEELTWFEQMAEDDAADMYDAAEALFGEEKEPLRSLSPLPTALSLPLARYSPASPSSMEAAVSFDGASAVRADQGPRFCRLSIPLSLSCCLPSLSSHHHLCSTGLSSSSSSSFKVSVVFEV